MLQIQSRQHKNSQKVVHEMLKELSDGHISDNFIRNFDITIVDFNGIITVGLDTVQWF